MEIYVQDESKKGFPVYSETVRHTAENWAKGWHGDTKYHIIKTTSDIFTNAKIIEIDSRDCTGGNAWKIEINCEIYDTETTGSYEKVIFDLREDKLLEILQKSSVKEGIIQCPLVVVARGAFAMEDGEYHQELINSQRVKTLKKIPVKDLVIGGIYTTGSSRSQERVYLGKMETRDHWGEDKCGHAFAYYREYEDVPNDSHLDTLEILTTPTMKVKVREIDSEEVIKQTVNYYSASYNDALKIPGDWKISYYRKKLNTWADIQKRIVKC